MEDGDVDNLADQEGNQRADNNPQALAEDQPVGVIVVADFVAYRQLFGGGQRWTDMGLRPEVGGREFDAGVKHGKGVKNQPCRKIGEHPDASGAVVFVDQICQHKHERPEQYASGEIEGKLIDAKKAQRQRLKAKALFEWKDFDADKLGNQRIGNKETRHHNKQADGFVAYNGIDH